MDNLHWWSRGLGDAAGSFQNAAGASRFKGDCKACINMIHAGLAVATSAERVLDRVYGMLLAALEDVGLERILWMPAHKSAAQVGKLRLSNGDLLTNEDVKGNDGADGGAKERVEEQRVPPAVIQEWC